MTRSRKLLLAGGALLALAGGAVGVAQAVGGDSEERATGPSADRAAKAAVESVGGGRAVEVERGDDGRAVWEVEVVRADDRQVEVHLDGSLNRIALEPDDDGAGDHDHGETER